MQKLLHLIKTKQLNLPTNFPANLNSNHFYQWKNTLYSLDWVVFTKKPFSGIKQVISYLGRYSHRVAITNQRILKIDKGRVFFSFKDYKDKAKKKIMSLSGIDFLKRFCLHILPPRFRKIRAFGIFSNASKAKSIAIARNALNVKHQQLLSRAQRKELAANRLFKQTFNECPCCQKGKMKTILMLPPNKAPPGYIIQLMKLI